MLDASPTRARRRLPRPGGRRRDRAEAGPGRELPADIYWPWPPSFYRGGRRHIDPDVDGVGGGARRCRGHGGPHRHPRAARSSPGSRLICEPWAAAGSGYQAARRPGPHAGCLISMLGIGIMRLVLAVTLPMQLLLYRTGLLRLGPLSTYGGIGLGVLWCAFLFVVAVGMSTARFVLTATPDASRSRRATCSVGRRAGPGRRKNRVDPRRHDRI